MRIDSYFELLDFFKSNLTLYLVINKGTRILLLQGTLVVKTRTVTCLWLTGWRNWSNTRVIKWHLLFSRIYCYS